MKIKKKLEHLLHYYTVTRQVGHTTGMVNGAANTKNSVVLVHDLRWGNELKKKLAKDALLASLNSKYILTGCNKPLFIDNAAMYVLLQDTLAEIQRLEEYEWKYKELSK